MASYPVQMVEKTLREVKYKDRKEALKQKSKIAEELLPFVSGNFTQHKWLLNANTQRYIQGATLDLL